MQYNLKGLMRIAAVLALILTFAIGCSTPVYFHNITHTYDAQGKLIKVEEVEGITQPNPSSSPMRVRIDYSNKIEK
ncbi:MAG TPA: hypothetical protein VEK32_18305 [Thermodesulfobacteriota bacterium]|nr:hypothetical protein [Thermodesulfobacteriota bacterium]